MSRYAPRMRAKSDVSQVFALPLRKCQSVQNGKPYRVSRRCMAFSISPGPRLSRCTMVRTYSVADSTLISGISFLDLGDMPLPAFRYGWSRRGVQNKGLAGGISQDRCFGERGDPASRK